MADERDQEERGPVTVRNRDIITLMNVKYIMREIEHMESRREWQRERMTNISLNLTGMPRGNGTPRGLDDAFAALSEMDEIFERKCRNYTRAIKAAQRILDGIESESMRAFVIMRYMNDETDTDIRKKLNMSRRGFDRARKAVEDAPRMLDVKWRERFILSEQ